MICPKCEDTSGLKSALRKQSVQRKKATTRAWKWEQKARKALRHAAMAHKRRDIMAMHLERSKRREAALERAYEELRAKHESAQHTIHKLLNP